MSIRTTLTGTAVALVTTGSLLVGAAAFAHFGGPRDPEQREQMNEIFETGDYAAWQALMEDKGPMKRMSDAITEENFTQFAEAHLLMQKENFEEARAIMEELGLPKGPRRGGRGFGGPNEEIRAALKSGDYDAWKAAHDDSGRHAGILDVITEENFAQFVEMHELMQSGDREGAQAIAQELDLPQGPAHGFDRGKGPGRFGGDCPCVQE